MKRSLACLVLLSLAALAPAQGGGAPDLTGEWLIDKGKSSLGFGLKGELADVTLLVAQRESEVRVTKKLRNSHGESIEESVYRIGGEAADGRAGRPSKWSGRKLVSKRTVQLFGLPPDVRPAESETVEEWELSADGRTLTHTISSTGVPGILPASVTKIVFNRVR